MSDLDVSTPQGRADYARAILRDYASISPATMNGAASLALATNGDLETLGRFYGAWNAQGPRNVRDLLVPVDFTQHFKADLSESIGSLVKFSNGEAWYACRIAVSVKDGGIDLAELYVDVQTTGNFRITAGNIPASVRFQVGLNNIAYEPPIRLTAQQQLSLSFFGTKAGAEFDVTVSGVALAF